MSGNQVGRRTPEKAKIICPPPSGVDIISNFKRGRRTWKLNSLLKDSEYIRLVNKCIREEYQKYAVPVYTPEFLEKCCYQDIHLTIAPDLFLEALLLRI